MKLMKKLGAAALVSASLALSACATGLPAKVTRYSAMPIPQGQSFYIVPADGSSRGLEFGRYAQLVSQHLAAKGYRNAGSPQAADMLVKIRYDVGEGETRREVEPSWGGYDPFYTGAGGLRRYYDPRTGRVFYRRDPFYDPFYGSYYGRPYYSRYGYWGARSPYYHGWGDPFWGNGGRYGSQFGSAYDRVREYTVFESEFEMDIVRRADNAPLFEGKAQARSQTDELGVLVPNLVEAMFTGFPGRSGETVRITVPARRR